MAALRTTKAEDDQLFDLTVSKNAEQVVSVVAFHGAVRSEPRYVRSASGGTGGQGQVLELGLLASLDGGVLTALEWDNLGGCADCGGTSSATCVQTEYDASRQTNPQESCAGASRASRAGAAAIGRPARRLNCGAAARAPAASRAPRPAAAAARARRAPAPLAPASPAAAAAPSRPQRRLTRPSARAVASRVRRPTARRRTWSRSAARPPRGSRSRAPTS
jgi:hypothetical protein